MTKAKADNFPVVILSNVHQGDCIGTFFPDSQIETEGPVTIRTIEDARTRVFSTRDGVSHDLPLSVVYIKDHGANHSMGRIGLSCHDIIHSHHVTFVERQMVFEYLDFTYDTTSWVSNILQQPQDQFYDAYHKNILVASGFARYEDFRLTEGRYLGPDKADELHVDANAAREISDGFPELIMNWRDTKSLLMRDVILLLSGAIFGLAGASIVEFIKNVMEQPRKNGRPREWARSRGDRRRSPRRAPRLGRDRG
jgi:hypothetical protein